jgi:hypothetical protein
MMRPARHHLTTCAAILLAAFVYSADAAAASMLSSGRLRTSGLREGALRRGSMSPGGTTAASPVFDTGDPASPTYGVPTSCPIAGQTLLALYVGDDVTSGGTGTMTGTGSIAVTLTGLNDATPVLSGEKPVPATTGWNPNGNRYQSASAPGLDFGTQDLTVLMMARQASSANAIAISNTAANRNGFELMTQTNGHWRCYIDDGVNDANDFVAAGIDEGSWNVGGCIIDRDGYAEAWAAGAGSGSPVNIASGAANDLNNSSDPFTVGAQVLSSSPYTDDIAWIQICGCTDCLTVGAGGNAHEADLDALYIDVAGHTLEAGEPIHAFSRAQTAWGRVCDPDTDSVVFHPYGNNWPRAEISCGGPELGDPFQGDHSSATLYRSFMQEAWRANAFTAPTDATNIAWTKTNLTAVANSSCGNTSFAYDTACTELRASSTASTQKSLSDGGANIDGEDSSWFGLKAGAVDYAQVHVDAGHWMTVDLTTCDVSNSGADNDFEFAMSTRNGWCYVGMSGDVAHATVSVYPCNTNAASAGCTYAAADTTSAQIYFEYGGSFDTPGALAGYRSPNPLSANGSDILVLGANVPEGPQTFVLDATFSRVDSYVESSTSGAAADSWELSRNGTDVRCRGTRSGVERFDVDTNTVLTKNARHILRGTWAADDVACYVDGSLEGTDTNTGGTAAPAANEVFFGKSGSSGDRPHALVWRVKIYEGAYAPGESGTGVDAVSLAADAPTMTAAPRGPPPPIEHVVVWCLAAWWAVGMGRRALLCLARLRGSVPERAGRRDIDGTVDFDGGTP